MAKKKPTTPKQTQRLRQPKQSSKTPKPSKQSSKTQPSSSKKKSAALNKEQTDIRKKRHALQNRIYRRKLKLKKIKRSKDSDRMTEYKKVSRQIIEIKSNVKHLNKELGIKQKEKPDLDKIKADLKKTSEETASADKKSDYIEDSAPYTVWEALKHVNSQIWNTRWDWIIVDGKRFSTKDEIRLEANIADAFSAFDSDDVITISYNPKTKTLRYELY